MSETHTNIDRLVMLPPYVAEEHRQLLSDAEEAVNAYSEMLLGRIKKELNNLKYGCNATPQAMAQAERAFLDDPVRQQMIRNLVEIRIIVEQPRFLVPAS